MRTLPVTINKLAYQLGISTDQYIDIFHENGCAFLEAQVLEADRKRMEVVTNAFKCSLVFWHWYSLQVQSIDVVFMRAVELGRVAATRDNYHAAQHRRQLVPPQEVVNDVIENSNLKVVGSKKLEV